MVELASRRGILQSCRFEALVLVPYPDDSTGGGKHSWGFGSQTDARPPATITVDEAFKLKRADVEAREAIVAKHCKKRGINPTQQQFDALLCRFYQAGTDDLEAILDRWSLATSKGQRVLFNSVWLAHCKDAKGNLLDGLQDRGIMELLLFWRGWYRPDIYEIPVYESAPAGRAADWIYRITNADITWRR